jgi:uncharacterized membrane protein YccF (DUF307 family)
MELSKADLENHNLTFHDSEEDSVAFHEGPINSNDGNSKEWGTNSLSKLNKPSIQPSSKFGLRPWGHNVVKKPQSRSIAENEKVQSFVKVQAIFWLIFYGWWMSLFFFLASGIMYLTVIGKKYSIMSYRLAMYIIYPFEKYVVEKRVLILSLYHIL